jgi:hypothetical protein
VAEGGSYTIDITADTAWTAIIDETVAEWCTVTPASGNGNDSITVCISENAFDAREATITISAGNLKKIITVTQDAARIVDTANLELTVIPVARDVRFYAVAQKLTVSWGDGITNYYTNVTQIAHTYGDNNTYTVKIKEEGLTEFGDKMYKTDDG